MLGFDIVYKGIFHCFSLLCSAGLGLLLGDIQELAATMRFLPWRYNCHLEPNQLTELTFYYTNKWTELAQSTSYIIFNMTCVMPVYLLYFYGFFYNQATSQNFDIMDEWHKLISWLVMIDVMTWITHTISHINDSTHALSHRRDSWYGFQSLSIHSIDWVLQMISVSVPSILVRPHWVTLVFVSSLLLFLKVWISNEFISKEYLAYTQKHTYYLHWRWHYYVHHYLNRFHKAHYIDPYYNRGMFGVTDMLMVSFK
jgi:hypothetical protein